MKHILLVSILVFCTFAGSAQADLKEGALAESKLKVKELASLPEGLTISHTPDPVFHIAHTPSISGVQWEHRTTVSSTVGPVTILEFGCFVERNGKWEYPHETVTPYTYSSSDFATMYDCPSSKLQPGKTYTDAKNLSVIDCVPEQMVKWYFIGQDANGQRVKGEATVKLISEFAK